MLVALDVNHGTKSAATLLVEKINTINTSYEHENRRQICENVASRGTK